MVAGDGTANNSKGNHSRPPNSFARMGGDMKAIEEARRIEEVDRRRQQRAINTNPKRRDDNARRRENQLRTGTYR